MANTGITVKKLRDMLNELIDEGMGDAGVLLTDDDEINGFHQCWDGAFGWTKSDATSAYRDGELSQTTVESGKDCYDNYIYIS